VTDLRAEVAAWLEEDDERSRNARAERAMWLVSLGHPESGWMVFGGPGSAILWDEVRRTFVKGEFIACILAGQALLENILAALLNSMLGPTRRYNGLSEILVEVRHRGWISDEEFEVLDRIRGLRNPYAHFRHPEHAQNLTRRMMRESECAEVLVERDAGEVVGALVHLMNRGPFALGPMIYPEGDGPAIHPDQVALPI
jgi:hypothetical protein